MKFKFSWAYVVVAVLGSFILFILTLIFTAGDTGSLITEEYYEKELVYQSQINAQKNANALPIKPSFKQQANGILIEFPTSIPKSVKGFVSLKKYANDFSDIQLALQLNRNHTFLVPANKLEKGEYLLELYFKHDTIEYLIKNPSLQWMPL